MRPMLRHLRTQSMRVLMLAGLLLLSGAAIGLAASYPLRFVDFDESNATRIDQARLAGTVDPEQALVTLDDLPKGWEPGDPALGGFGILSSDFCGEVVATPAPLSEAKSSVFKDDTDDAVVISQALRADNWQLAKTYVNDVEDALDECSQFYRTGPNGKTKIEITDSAEAPLIADDFVGATYVDESGELVQEWAIFVVGDVIVSVLHSAPTRPEPPFLNDVIEKVLARIDPQDFAPGGITPDTAVSSPEDGSSGTLDGGSADESGGIDSGPVDEGGAVGEGGAVDEGGGEPAASTPASTPSTTAPRR